MMEAYPGEVVNKAINEKRFIYLRQALKVGYRPGENTLTLAVRTGDVDIINMILKYNAKPDQDTLPAAQSTGKDAVIELISTLDLPAPLVSDSSDNVSSRGSVRTASSTPNVAMSPTSPSSPRSPRSPSSPHSSSSQLAARAALDNMEEVDRNERSGVAVVAGEMSIGRIFINFSTGSSKSTTSNTNISKDVADNLQDGEEDERISASRRRPHK